MYSVQCTCLQRELWFVMHGGAGGGVGGGLGAGPKDPWEVIFN